MTSLAFTADEVICVCIARQIQDGEIVAQGLATPLVVAGYLLAKCTHAPNLMFASAIGQGVCREWAPLGLARVEALWLDKSLSHVGFVRAVTELLPSVRPLEFFRPAQVDACGNFNNIALGADYRHPRLRLPGSGGIPDVTLFEENVSLYVPRHSRLTFVEKVDFVSGLGHVAGRVRGAGPRYLVTDLGQFDFAGGRMRVTSVHPGATLERIRAKTGFVLDVAPDCAETPPPTPDELHLLRDVIDPLGMRRLETLGGAARKDALREILEAEGAI
jgi:acyl CoA:acetate/3-ketoacid CoA transferase beta subunit